MLYHKKFIISKIIIFFQVFADKMSHYAGQSVALVIAGELFSSSLC